MAIIYKHRKAPLPRLPERFAPAAAAIDRLLAKKSEDRMPLRAASRRVEALEDAARDLKLP